jgi:hypothetical protein
VRALRQRKINRGVQSQAEEKCAPRAAADISFVRPSRIKENAFLRREKRFLAFAASAPETI